MIDTAQGAPHDGAAPSKLRQWSSFIGIVTAIVGNILISFALNIQRYAHIRMERDRQRRGGDGHRRPSRDKGYGTQQQSQVAEERAQINLSAPIHNGLHSEHGSQLSGKGKSNGLESTVQRSQRPSLSTLAPSEKTRAGAEAKTYLSSPYWWAGILLMTIGEAGNFLAYGFAPASIVSPLGVVALVSNCIIAPCLLKERFRQRDFWGVVVAVGGAVTVVFSANNSEQKLGPHEVWSAISRWEFELYLGVTSTLIIVLMYASGKYGSKSILIDLGLVGLYGGYTALSTKGVASLLSDTLWRTLTFPVTYLLVFVLVSTAFLQIRYLNRALQRFDSTQVIPTQFVLFTLSVIIGSAILYRDFESATAERFAKFIGGCILTFLGVYLITSGREKGGGAQDDGIDIGDEEEGIGLIDEERYEDDPVEEESDRQNPKAGILNEGFSESSRRQSGSSIPPQILIPRALSSTSDALTDTDEGVQTPMIKNPWRRSLEDIFRDPPSTENPRPGLFSSQSADPAAPLQPATPPREQISRRQSYQQKTPDLPQTISRRSISRMMPGPLISPLSSPLSAIVADTIRRGVDSPGHGGSRTRRPRLSGLLQKAARLQRSSAPPADGSDEGNIGSSPLKQVGSASDAVMDSERYDEHGYRRPHLLGASSGDKKGRSKSLSGALGGFFGMWRDVTPTDTTTTTTTSTTSTTTGGSSSSKKKGTDGEGSSGDGRGD